MLVTLIERRLANDAWVWMNIWIISNPNAEGRRFQHRGQITSIEMKDVRDIHGATAIVGGDHAVRIFYRPPVGDGPSNGKVKNLLVLAETFDDNFELINDHGDFELQNRGLTK